MTISLKFQKHTSTKRLIKPSLAAALLLGFAWFTGSAMAESSLPRFTIDQLDYQGAFRIPNGTFGSSTVSYSYGAIGFNPDRHSIFIAGHERQGAVAEFTIPQLVKSTTITDLKMAGAPVQGFSNVVNKAAIDQGQGIVINGLFYSNNKLMVNVYRFYDQSPYLQTPTLILDNATNIASSPARGYLTFAGGSKAAGWISPIPAEFQSVLGGTHITGFSSSTGRALIHNGSVGPSAYAFNPVEAMANSSSITKINSIELMSYSLGQTGLISEDSQLYQPGQIWTHASEASYGIIVPGTRSYLVVGGSGGHQSGMSYGNPPYGGYKGHYTNDQYDKYPYYWLFDVNDLEKVRNGQMRPYSVRPYAHGKLAAPFQTSIANYVKGGTFDSATGIMYLTIETADNLQGAGNPPIIVAYKFKTAGSPAQNSPPNAPQGINANIVN